AAGELDLLDRAYCNPPDLAHARAGGGHVIVRYNRGTLPLYDAHGRALDVVPKVRRLRRPGRVRSWSAWVHTDDGPIAVRVCAVRLSATAAQRAQDWLRREKGPAVTADDLDWAQVLVGVTTGQATHVASGRALALFRAPWH